MPYKNRQDKAAQMRRYRATNLKGVGKLEGEALDNKIDEINKALESIKARLDKNSIPDKNKLEVSYP